jgi:hypothetical protein
LRLGWDFRFLAYSPKKNEKNFVCDNVKTKLCEDQEGLSQNSIKFKTFKKSLLFIIIFFKTKKALFANFNHIKARKKDLPRLFEN